MAARVKFGFALIAAAILLFTSIAACSAMPVAPRAAHPCCPKAPQPVKECGLCMRSAPVPIAIPTTGGDNIALEPLQNLEIQPVQPAVATTYFAHDSVSSFDRCLAFHQLLV